MSDRPKIILATASYDDNEVVLRLEDRDRVAIEFAVDPVGMAMLSLTLGPAMKLALVDLKAQHPEEFPERAATPDTPEGL